MAHAADRRFGDELESDFLLGSADQRVPGGSVLESNRARAVGVGIHLRARDKRSTRGVEAVLPQSSIRPGVVEHTGLCAGMSGVLGERDTRAGSESNDNRQRHDFSDDDPSSRLESDWVGQ